MNNSTNNWYSLSINEIYAQLDTSFQGIKAKDVLSRRQKYGKNYLPEPKKPSFLKLFISQFKNSLIYILLSAVIISLILQEYTDAGLITIILLINALIGSIQEWNAEKNAANLNQLLQIKARVKRDKQLLYIGAEDLVVGDVVLLEAGSKVAADLRIIEAVNLKIDESFLTGESISVEKHSESIVGDKLSLLE